jgi:Carboxypeptidase regulatory-like domain/TonB-dependent Receptor Plug Domain
MPMRLVCRFLWVLLLCPAALAQTTGDIEGKMTDAWGKPLPGVTIEATSPKMQGARVEVSGPDGLYRVLAVPPGEYRIRASLEGFETVERLVTVALDSRTTIDLRTKLIVRESVTVSGEIPLIDLTSTTSGTNYTNKVIAKLPVARNYADIVRSNPGVSTDRGETQGRSLALSIYGATSVENQWIIDGINTTNVIKGFQGKAINNEFIDEIEVKTGGYQAEYGRALGGIVNVITRSGGNQFRGDAFVYYESGNTRAEQIVTAQDSLTGMKTTPSHRADSGADLGGYVLKDRLWFFAAYNRVDTPGTASRYNSSPQVPSTMLFPRDQTDDLYSGKLTWNIASHSNLVATAFSDPSTVSGAARVGTRGGCLTCYGKSIYVISSPDPSTWENERKIGGLDYGLRFSELPGSSAVLTAQASAHRDRFELFVSPAGDTARREDWTCVGGTPDNPCVSGIEEQEPNSVTGGLGWVGGPQQRNTSRRDQYRLDAALYGGNHEVKLGGDYLAAKTAAIVSFTGGQIVKKYNEFGQTYYWHHFFSKSPTDLTPVDNVNEAHSKDFGLFLQDSWKPVRSLTINAGLRWDQQKVQNSVGDTVLNMSAEWQPRLGIVWDPTGKGEARVYASAGRFYYALPTALSVFSYDSTTEADTYNFDPVDKKQDPNVIGHEKSRVFVQGYGEPVDSGVKGIYQDELTVGIEKLLDPTFSVGVKATYRRLGRVIEDRCDLDYSAPENNFFPCALVNPGSDGKYARGDFPSCNGLEKGLDGKENYACQQGAPALGPARRVYRGIEVSGRKSFGETLWLQASYVYSSLRGNYDGFVNQDYGQTTPGVSADLDYPQFVHNDYGRLYLDRPHSFRLDAAYTTPFKLFVGLQGYVQSGSPLNRMGYFNQYYSSIYLVPRGSAKTLRTLWEANLTLGYPVAFGPVTVTLQAYLFNVFNNQFETGEDVFYTTRQPPGYPSTLYDPNVPADKVNANYGKIVSRQDPRLLRAAVKIAF